MKRCGACGNPRKGKAREIYVRESSVRLRRVLACALCFAKCIHILVAPPLQLTRSSEPSP